MATTLSNTIPALMMEMLINNISFVSTNCHHGGEVITTISAAKSITNIDLRDNYERFKFRLEKEILFDLSFGNQEMYSIAISADLFGDMQVTVSYGGGAPLTFTTPSFCDSLLSPVITTQKQNYLDVVNDIGTLIGNINMVDTNFMVDTSM